MHHPRQLPLTALLGKPPNPSWGYRPKPRMDEAAASSTAEKEESEVEQEKRKKRRGKPQDRSKLTRNKVVQIRLTEKEVADLKAAAAADDMSMADFIMAGVHESRRIVMPGAIALRKELMREGNNLNQTLALAHAARKEGRPVDLQSIRDAAEKVEENLGKLEDLILKWDIDLTAMVKKEAKADADRQM